MAELPMKIAVLDQLNTVGQTNSDVQRLYICIHTVAMQFAGRPRR
ncbi:MAG: hypothetical protein P8N30_11690 [Tateyamaria sp.]|nr:hypothetical protein [Tateyamaria sp.]